jgi:hypothetical protein
MYKFWKKIKFESSLNLKGYKTFYINLINFLKFHIHMIYFNMNLD